MARINVEEKWWTDERRYKLAEILGSIYEADGLALAAWKLAQEFYGRGRRRVPVLEFQKIHKYEFLFQTNLAQIVGDVVYVSGTKEHHKWYAQRVAASAKGGKSNKKEVKQTDSQKGSQTPCQTDSQKGSPPNSFLIPPSSIKEKNTTTGEVNDIGLVSENDLRLIKPASNTPSLELNVQIEKCFAQWNKTLKAFGASERQMSQSDQMVLARALKTLGFDRCEAAIIGKRYEKPSAGYDPKNTLSLEYCLHRNLKTGASNHERLAALASIADNEKKTTKKYTLKELKELATGIKE
jgi:hypothetical protein